MSRGARAKMGVPACDSAQDCMKPFAIACAALLAVGLAGVSPAASGSAQAPAAGDIASRVQKRYDTIRDFTATFVHTYEGGVLRRKLTERGVVQVKKPGRMRWEYQSPEKKLFVSDGTQMYLYEVAANQVTVFPVPKGDEAATAVLFLAGKGNVTRDFIVSHADGGTDSAYALRLTPKSPERDYDWLVLHVDRTTYQIRTLSAADAQGGRSTFEFTNIRENTGLADRTFTFTIPRGADVVRHDAAR
jgi:outer membrane lipoprotein carrier protein